MGGIGIRQLAGTRANALLRTGFVRRQELWPHTGLGGEDVVHVHLPSSLPGLFNEMLASAGCYQPGRDRHERGGS